MENSQFSVLVFDKEDKKLFQNEDGEAMIFKSEIDAKNFLFLHSYTEEYATKKVDYIPVVLVE